MRVIFFSTSLSTRKAGSGQFGVEYVADTDGFRT